MSNKLFQAMGSMANPYSQMIGEINKFSQSIKGDPRQMVQKLLDTGEMSQADFNKLSQMAQQIMPFFTNVNSK